jgi:hypothetical protein
MSSASEIPVAVPGPEPTCLVCRYYRRTDAKGILCTGDHPWQVVLEVLLLEALEEDNG